ncbi:MAG TPA: hypothetical protein VFA84_09635 [Acidimicrobiales bacterium]|nr:hypothetical protein [Acidimicrobiales bacterium]
MRNPLGRRRPAAAPLPARARGATLLPVRERGAALLPVRLRRPAAVLLPLGVALAVTAVACGGGSAKVTATTAPPTTAAAASTPQGGGGRGLGTQLAAFRSCMASHGEPLPTFAPRPSTTVVNGAPASPPDSGGPRGGGFGFFGGGGGGNGLGFVLRGLDQNDPKVMAAYNACKSQIPASLIQNQQQRQQQLNAFISCMADHGVTITTGAPAAGTTRTTLDQNSTAYQTCKVLLPNGGAFGPRGTTTTTAA